jgi:hypothetical protein
MPYGIAVPIIYSYFLIRMWRLHSRGIAIVFLGLWGVVMFGFPLLHLPVLASPLTEIGLGIILILIDRYKTGEAFGLKSRQWGSW